MYKTKYNWPSSRSVHTKLYPNRMDSPGAKFGDFNNSHVNITKTKLDSTSKERIFVFVLLINEMKY